MRGFLLSRAGSWRNISRAGRHCNSPSFHKNGFRSLFGRSYCRLGYGVLRLNISSLQSYGFLLSHGGKSRNTLRVDSYYISAKYHSCAYRFLTCRMWRRTGYGEWRSNNPSLRSYDWPLPDAYIPYSISHAGSCHNWPMRYTYAGSARSRNPHRFWYDRYYPYRRPHPL